MERGGTAVERHRSERSNRTFWRIDRELSKTVPPAIAVATGGAAIGTIVAGPGGAVAGAILGAATGAAAGHRQR